MRELARRALGSVRVRLTIVATLVFALAFSLAAVVLVWRVRTSLEDSARESGVRALNVATARVQSGAEIGNTAGQWVAGPDGTQIITTPLPAPGARNGPGTSGSTTFVTYG